MRLMPIIIAFLHDGEEVDEDKIIIRTYPLLELQLSAVHRRLSSAGCRSFVRKIGNSLSQKFAYSALVQRPVKLDLNILTFGAFRFGEQFASSSSTTAMPVGHFLFCCVWSVFSAFPACLIHVLLKFLFFYCHPGESELL